MVTIGVPGLRTFASRLFDLRTAVFKATNLPAAMAVAVIVVFGLFADYQNNLVFRQNLRADVLAELAVIRAKLEGNVTANLQLVRGFIATLMTEPEMDQARFDALAANLLAEDSQLRSIAVAPDLVITMTYPLKGNERAIGLDYRTNEAQREAALRVMETGELILAGPVDLVQGGRGFVGRFPVFVDGTRKSRFWGLVSAVIDVDRLYRDSGLVDPDLPIEVGIVGKDALGGMGAQFFGVDGLFDSDPVTSEVLLPSGSWLIGAVPRGGWSTVPPNAWQLRILTMLFGALIVFPMVVGGRLMEERQRNLTELGEREAELQRLSRRLSLALETSRIGVWEYDIESGDLVWDDRMNEIYGLPADRAPRRYNHWRERLHADDFERAREDFRIAVEVTGQYNSDYRIVTPQNEVRSIRAIGRVYEDPGQNAKIVGVNWDVTVDVALNERLKNANRLSEARNAELEATKARIEHNALHDALTGLPNRRYLDEVLRRGAEEQTQRGGQLALLHIDLDRFKQINDTLGHAAGDAMLIHASKVLLSKLRTGDFVARIGGDEFVVVCSGDSGDDVLAGLAGRVIETMREPVSYDGHECRFGVSVGIALERGTRIDPQRLLINADIALYRAKARGRNRFEFFTEALQADVVKTKRVADEILNGLEQNEFLPFYQPQFDAHTLDVVGAEALARWAHPNGAILAPVEFMAVAEDLNVVSTIDRTILEQALRDRATWSAAGIEIPRLSVNVSARRLQDEGLVGTLRQLAIEPGTVSFELVESIFLDESDDLVMFNIDQIKDLGIDVEIDDFGTGYASIVSLTKLKPKRLKIDRQLVEPIVGSQAQRQLVASIVDIGQSLGIQVVGEGVETLEHASILRDLGCDILQGYAFSRPLSSTDFTAFVRSGSWRVLGGAPDGGRHAGRGATR
jgi:diguanylate cyclase (GGDEF)-like protein